jgi:DNA-binding PadR family transcriptional regulator
MAISDRIAQITNGAFKVNAGSLFPSLHRLEQGGFVSGKWRRLDDGRRVKTYHLTTAGPEETGQAAGGLGPRGDRDGRRPRYVRDTVPVLHRLSALWRSCVDRAQLDRELDDELQTYLELTSRIANGADPLTARRLAMAELGLDSIREKSNETAGGDQSQVRSWVRFGGCIRCPSDRRSGQRARRTSTRPNGSTRR